MSPKNRRNRIGNILAGINPFDSQVREDFVKGLKDDYSIGREDSTKMYYRQRDLEGSTPESTRAANMLNTHTGLIRAKEAAGMMSGPALQALNESDMALRGSQAHKAGQMVGTGLNDLTQDRSRSIYWLLNALQATGEVINEATLAKFAPSLYQRTTVNHPTLQRMNDAGVKEPMPMSFKNAAHRELMIRKGMAKQVDEKVVPARGYSTNNQNELQRQNYSPGMVQSLAIPTGIAINSGLGLLTPFGGAEGYKAALPSEDDPTKTSNVIGEVGMKYILGRTGQLLPYNEFVKVRPDVSRDEYERYQAFKYDKREDYNPADGDVTIGGGALKATDEGIHGPELQFLGRSLPVTTGIVPYASALAGGVIGARRGVKNNKAAGYGLIGGMAGLAAGQVTGHVIEAERRRRNINENLQQGTL